MPRRRTDDVVLVAVTDHFIRRRPGKRNLKAARDERDPVIRSVELLPLVGAPQGADDKLYRAVAEVRANPTARTVDQLARLLRSSKPPELAPWLELARGQLKLGRLAKVEATAKLLLQQAPDLPLAHEWLGLSLAGQRRFDEAAAALRRSLELDPTRPESHFNLALLLLESQPAAAAAHLERAVEQRPVLVEGWYRLADAYLRLGRGDEALAAIHQALAVDPDHAAANAAQRILVPGVSGSGRNRADGRQ